MSGVLSQLGSLLGAGRRAPAHVPTTTVAHTSPHHGKHGPRMIRKEGWLQKEGESNTRLRQRWFRLNGLALTYYTPSDELRGVIHLQDAVLKECPRQLYAHGFTITVQLPHQQANLFGLPKDASMTGRLEESISGGSLESSTDSSLDKSVSSVSKDGIRRYTMVADSEADKQEWMHAILNNINYEHQLLTFHEDEKDALHAQIAQLRGRIEEIRVEREKQLLEESIRRAEENRNKKVEEKEEKQKDIHTDLLSKEVGHLVAGDASRPQAASISVSPYVGDTIGSRDLDADSLIEQLKRKNMNLEKEIRLLVEENTTLRAQAVHTTTSNATTEQAPSSTASNQLDDSNIPTLVTVSILPASTSNPSSAAQSAENQVVTTTLTVDTASSDSSSQPPSTTTSTSTTPAHASAPLVSPLPSPSPSHHLKEDVPSSLIGRHDCLCKCEPSCVPFSSHKLLLIQYNDAKNLASKYRSERKLLKNEVIRLMGKCGEPIDEVLSRRRASQDLTLVQQSRATTS